MAKLTTTSYALLALLSRQPFSAYELNKHMQNSVLRAFWPRAESHVYSEPKKLLKAGLVTCTGEESGGRSRSVYHITDAGREELGRWLATPTNSYAQQQFEGMVKFICADSTDVNAMRQNLYDIRRRALLDAQEAVHGIAQVDRSDIPPGRSGMPFNAMAINFLIDQIENRIRWVDDAIEALADTGDTGDGADNRALGNDYYERALARLDAILSAG